MARSTSAAPSKSSFPGERKDRNAAHSRVYRQLQKENTAALADEIAALKDEAEMLGAAQLLSCAEPLAMVPPLVPATVECSLAPCDSSHAELDDDAAPCDSSHAELDGDAAPCDSSQAELDGDAARRAAERRRQRKALAAKAARKRARERLMSLESEANSLRAWVATLRAQVAAARLCHVASGGVEDESDEGTLAQVPPKKRRRHLSTSSVD